MDNHYIITLPEDSTNQYLKSPKYLFIGRDKVKRRLKNAISNSITNGASFLIGGYRGVGKSALVNLIIDEIKDEIEDEIKCRSKCIETRIINYIGINLSINNQLNTHDILFDITQHIYKLISERRGFLWKCSIARYALNALLFYIPINYILTSYKNVINLNINSFALLNFNTTNSDPSLSTFLFYLIPGSLLLALNISIARSTLERTYRRTKDLLLSFKYTRVIEHTIGAPEKFGFNVFKRINSENTITTRRAQNELIEILNDSIDAKPWWKPRFSTFIVFDEVDKINPGVSNDLDHETNKSRKEKIDKILGALKPLFTDTKAIFLVIAGREMVDGFHSESGYTSVLYESVFQDIFYIPSLLSDHSDGKNSDISSMVGEYVDRILTGNTDLNNQNLSDIFFKTHAKQYEYYLEKKYSGTDSPHRYLFDLYKHNIELRFIRDILIKYLTLHSRGNCKRLSMMFKEFIFDGMDPSIKSICFNDSRSLNDNVVVFSEIPEDNRPILYFRPDDIKRLHISAKFYTYYDMSLARHLYKSDDKLIVSSLITLLDVTRYHGLGFNRAMLERTVSGIDVHAESNLSHIIDELIGSTFYSILRRTSDNLFQYRFYLGSEIELMYLTRIIGARASSFEFSLDSADPVRKHYLQEIGAQSENENVNSRIATSKLKIILGDIYLSERNYDKCYSCYADAISLLKGILRASSEMMFRQGGGVSQTGHTMLVHALMKKGLLEEIRENNSTAIKTYEEAIIISRYTLEKVKKGSDNEDIISVNSYLDNVDNPNEWMNNHGIKDLNIRNLTLLANSIAAYEFIALKSNIDCRSFFRKKLYKLDASSHACNSDQNESNASNFRLYGKMALFSFYYGDHENLINNGTDFIKTLFLNFNDKNDLNSVEPKIPANKQIQVFRKSNPFMLSYLYGQSLFCSAADHIRTKLEATKKSERLNNIVNDWSALIFDLHNKKIDDIRYWTPGKNIKELTSIFNSKSIMGGTEPFLASFGILLCSAIGMEKRGRHALAVEIYNSIILNWIALLELVPWRSIKDVKPTRKLPPKFSTHTPRWIYYCIRRAQQCTSKANLTAMANDRARYFSEVDLKQKYVVCNFKHDLIDVLQLFDQVCATCESNRLPQSSASLSSLPIWYRSNSSCYQLIFSLWEKYCRTSIAFWHNQRLSNGRPENFYIEALHPPISTLPRVSSIYWWLRGRNAALQAITKKSDLISDGKFKSLNSEDIVLDAYYCLTKAIQESKFSSRSEDPDTFPPKAIMYFNLFELIIEFSEKLNFEEKNDFLIKFQKLNPSFPLILLSKNHLENVVHRQLSDLREISNITSNTFRKKMKNKYFLYDDFEDPMFISEWSFVSMLSACSDLYHLTPIMKVPHDHSFWH